LLNDRVLGHGAWEIAWSFVPFYWRCWDGKEMVPAGRCPGGVLVERDRTHEEELKVYNMLDNTSIDSFSLQHCLNSSSTSHDLGHGHGILERAWSMEHGCTKLEELGRTSYCWARFGYSYTVLALHACWFPAKRQLVCRHGVHVFLRRASDSASCITLRTWYRPATRKTDSVTLRGIGTAFN
jgi:hypothetical protein